MKSIPKLNKGPRQEEEVKNKYKHTFTPEDIGGLLFGIHNHYPMDKNDLSKANAEKIIYFEEDLLPILKFLGIPEPKWGKSISLDDMEDEMEVRMFQSQDFKDDFMEAVKKDTWDKGLPMYYMDEDGWLVEHWGTGFKVLKKKLR